MEVKILRHLNPIIHGDTTINKNIVSLKDCFPGLITNNNNDNSIHHKMTYTDLYLGYSPLCDTDLHQIIRSPQQLSNEHIKFFLYQLLRGIKYLHSADIVHRDLKPSNLLVNANCDLVICDLGLAGSASSTTSDKLANAGEYVVTRWYRAPELLISCGSYTTATDMYSVGCIFAEMLGRKPLFPGNGYLHQLNLIFKVIGTPTTFTDSTSNNNNHVLRKYLESSVPYTPPAQLDRIFPHAPPAALDLLSRMLSFHPEHRPTAEQALQHPFLAGLHDPSDEPCCPNGVFNREEGFDYLGATMGQVREELWKEMCWYNPQLDNIIIS